MGSVDILIVDDDAALRETLVQVMQDEGFRTAGAANGREALEYLRSHPPPNVILLDMMMPEMNGEEFREEQLRDARLSAVPVVVMSASGRLHELVSQMNPAATLTKPVSLDAVLSALQPYLPK